MSIRGGDPLLVLSQVILSLQLSFAIVPLIHFTGDRRKMGAFATPNWAKALAWVTASVIMFLNLKLVLDTIAEGFAAGNAAVRFLLLPVTLLVVPLLAWMIVEPFWRKWRDRGRAVIPTPLLPPLSATLSRQYRRIGIALEASERDAQILAGVLPLARAASAEVVLIHVVESATARFIGRTVNDEEARLDSDYLGRVAAELSAAGFACSTQIGAGEPEDEIARIASKKRWT